MKKTSRAIVAAALLLAAATASAAEAAKPEDFATGNMADAVKGMDTNGDGLISKDEYIAYESARYDKDAAQVPTGNMTDAVKAQRASKREAYLKQQERQYGTYSKGSNGQVSAKEMVGYLKGPSSK